MIKEITEGKITYIMGPLNSGKTTYLKRKIAENPDNYIGFLSLPIYFYHGLKNYYLKGINIPIEGLLTAPDPLLLHPPLFYWRKRFFSQFMFDTVTEFVIEDSEISTNNKIFVIDEVGPLEKTGKGWNKLIDFLVKNNVKLIMVVRRKESRKKLENKF